MIQPALYIRGIAGGIAAKGVQIYENSPVLALEQRQDWQITTPKGRITAPRVILAVNGHAGSFGQFRGRLMHIFTYGSMTRALSEAEVASLGGQPTWGLTPADPLGTTVRRISGTGGDRIIIRNWTTFNPSMQAPARWLAQITKAHDASFAARFPMLKGVAMQYRWGGRLCLSRNGVAAFGEVAPGLYAACCQNGLGTTKGTLHGLLAAEQASGMSSEYLDQVLTAPPPTKLPPTPIAWVGANALLRWRQYRAGAEF